MHLFGRCSCGRKMNLPKWAKLGYRYRCWGCGRTWTLATHGKPLQRRSSLPPPGQAAATPPPSPVRHPVPDGGRGGCLALVVVGLLTLAVAGVTAVEFLFAR